MKNDFSIENFSQKLLTSCERVQLKTFEKNACKIRNKPL